jgi:hypothetical protein
MQVQLAPVVVQFGKEASQTRDYSVAKNAAVRAARPDPSLRKSGLLGMTIKLHHYLAPSCVSVLADRVYWASSDSANGLTPAASSAATRMGIARMV